MGEQHKSPCASGAVATLGLLRWAASQLGTEPRDRKLAPVGADCHSYLEKAAYCGDSGSQETDFRLGCFPVRTSLAEGWAALCGMFLSGRALFLRVGRTGPREGCYGPPAPQGQLEALLAKHRCKRCLPSLGLRRSQGRVLVSGPQMGTASVPVPEAQALVPPTCMSRCLQVWSKCCVLFFSVPRKEVQVGFKPGSPQPASGRPLCPSLGSFAILKGPSAAWLRWQSHSIPGVKGQPGQHPIVHPQHGGCPLACDSGVTECGRQTSPATKTLLHRAVPGSCRVPTGSQP